MNESLFQQAAEVWGRRALVGIFFIFPIKPSLSNVLLAVLLVACVFAGQYRARWTLIKRNPITLPAVIMFGLVVVGATYSQADLGQIANHLNKYSKFLILLVCLTFLTDPEWRDRCRRAFMYSMTFVVLSTYGNIWFQLPWSVTGAQGWGNDHTVVKDYIFQGICTALFVLMAWSEAVSKPSPRAKCFWAGMAVLGGLSCTHLLGGRTGFFALGAALVVYTLAMDKGQAKRGAVAGAILLSAVAATLSGTAVNKSRLALLEVEKYRQSAESIAVKVGQSSSGARLAMWELSLQEIAKRPLLGAGTASYHGLAKDRLKDPIACAIACVHPHNQFLFFGVEYGLVGMLAFGFYFVRAGQHALRLSPLLKATTLGFLAIFMVDSMVHGSMWLSGEQHLFTYMVALWMSYPAADADPPHNSSTRLPG